MGHYGGAIPGGTYWSEKQGYQQSTWDLAKLYINLNAGVHINLKYRSNNSNAVNWAYDFDRNHKLKETLLPIELYVRSSGKYLSLFSNAIQRLEKNYYLKRHEKNGKQILVFCPRNPVLDDSSYKRLVA